MLQRYTKDSVGELTSSKKTQAQTLEYERYKNILMKFTCRKKYSE
jgi:hypothetical protein